MSKKNKNKLPPFKVIVETINEKGARIKLKNVRCAFVKLAKPGKTLGGDFQYEITPLIPKKATPEFNKLQKCLEDTIGQSDKLKDGKAKAAALKLVRAIHIEKSFFKDGDKLVDGSNKPYDGCAGHYTIKAKTKAEENSDGTYKPSQGLILRYARTNEDIQPEEQANQLVSGYWYDLSLFLSPYDYLGTKSVTTYLQGVSLLMKDSRFGGIDPFSEARDDLPEDTFEEIKEY